MATRMLFSAGADPDTGKGSESALCQASAEDHEDIPKLLLDAHANVNTGVRVNSTVYQALERGHEDTVRLILDPGSQVFLRIRLEGNAPQSTSKTGHEKLMHRLLKLGMKSAT